MSATTPRSVSSKGLARPRVGFAGVGEIGRHRLEAVSTLGQITVAAVADPVAANREAALAIAPGARLVTLAAVLDALYARCRR